MATFSGPQIIHRSYMVRPPLSPVGCARNGTTDDSAAIQAVIDAVANDAGYTKGGGSIFLPPGVYALSTSLQVPDWVAVVGTHPEATMLKMLAGADVPAIVNKSYGGSPEVFAQGVGIYNLSIDGNAANQSSSSAHGIELRGTGAEQLSGERYYDFRHRIVNVMITNVKGSGVVSASRGEHRYKDVWVKGARQYGFKPTYDVWMTTCTAEHSGRAGFYLDSYAGHCMLTSCRSFWNGRDDWAVAGTSHGYHLESCQGVKMIGCSSQDNQDFGILMDSGTRFCQISEVECLNNALSKSGDDRVAIDMWDADQNRITGATWQRSVSHTASNQYYSIRMRGGATGNYAHLTHDSSNYHPSNHSGSGNTITVLG